MYCVVLLCGVLSIAATAIISDEARARLVKYESTNDGAGNYKFSYEISNGISRDEIGYLVNVGKDAEHMVVLGSYAYTDIEGKRVSVKYTADENGFHVAPPESVPQVSYEYSGVPPSVLATLLGK